MKIPLGYRVQESFSYFNQNPIGLYSVHLRETFFLAFQWKSHWFIQWQASAIKFLVLQSKSHRVTQCPFTRNIFSCISMKIPLVYTVDKCEKDFLALRSKSHRFTQGPFTRNIFLAYSITQWDFHWNARKNVSRKWTLYKPMGFWLKYEKLYRTCLHCITQWDFHWNARKNVSRKWTLYKPMGFWLKYEKLSCTV